VTADEYENARIDLLTELENQGQQILRSYLAGSTLKRSDYLWAAAIYRTASSLAPEQSRLVERQLFFGGRAATFDYDFPRSLELLNAARKLNPAGAYIENALGIVYLQQHELAKANDAFKQAAALAPAWVYVRFNWALAADEQGSDADAMKHFHEAQALAPDRSYVPYALGLYYQRHGRVKDASASYRTAIRIEPLNPEPFNALGVMDALAHHYKEARGAFERALQVSPQSLNARHNLGILCSLEPNQRLYAIRLWEENVVEDPSFLPSRLHLANALSAVGDLNAAAEQYRAIIALGPNVAALVRLAELDARRGRLELASTGLERAFAL